MRSTNRRAVCLPCLTLLASPDSAGGDLGHARVVSLRGLLLSSVCKITVPISSVYSYVHYYNVKLCFLPLGTFSLRARWTDLVAARLGRRAIGLGSSRPRRIHLLSINTATRYRYMLASAIKGPIDEQSHNLHISKINEPPVVNNDYVITPFFSLYQVPRTTKINR